MGVVLAGLLTAQCTGLGWIIKRNTDAIDNLREAQSEVLETLAVVKRCDLCPVRKA
jgi:hypothetical protein